MSFLDGLIGVKEVTAEGADAVPTRGTLHLAGNGITLADDAEANETIVTFAGGPDADTAPISPPTLTADAVDYNPTGLDAANLVRLSIDDARALHGLAAPSDGGEARKTLTLVTAPDSTALEIKHASGSVTTAKPFYCPSAASYFLSVPESIDVVYDATAQHWRVIP